MLCVYLREEAESSFPTINKPIALCHIGGELGLPSAALMPPNGGMSGQKKPEVLGKALHSCFTSPQLQSKNGHIHNTYKTEG